MTCSSRHCHRSSLELSQRFYELRERYVHHRGAFEAEPAFRSALHRSSGQRPAPGGPVLCHRQRRHPSLFRLNVPPELRPTWLAMLSLFDVDVEGRRSGNGRCKGLERFCLGA